MSLAFDKETHVYRWDGRVVPSVTQAIKAAGCMGYVAGGSEWHMNRGTVFHKVAELWDLGELEADSIDPAVAAHFAAYQEFRETVGSDLEILEIEEARYHDGLGYAGTRDRVVKWRGRVGVLDLKTGGRAPWHALQTAGYLALSKHAVVRLALYLGADGRWNLVEHADRGDWPAFASAVALWKWRARNGLLPDAA